MRMFSNNNQAQRPAQTDRAAVRQKLRVWAAVGVATLVATFFTGCAQLERTVDRGRELTRAVDFRVGFHNGRAQIEGSVAGYGLGVNLGARIITPLSPGVLLPAQPAERTEPQRWELLAPTD